jgi:hypothetical protein
VHRDVSNCHVVAGGSLIDLVVSRLALRATARRAATALTRPDRLAQRLQRVGPNNVVMNHCIERGDHLAHHRHDDDLAQLTDAREAVVERLKHKIAITGAHGRHVEYLADAGRTAPDATLSFKLAAVEGVGRDADQSGDLLASHAAKFGQERDQRAGEHPASK